MDRQKTQTNILHAVMAVFFVLLIAYFPSLMKFEDYFIYFATVLFSVHFWYGAYFLLKTLGPSQSVLDFVLDISIIALKIWSIYTILIMPLWFLVNGVLMGLGVVKYHIASKKKHTKGEKKYILKKISIEILTVSAFFIFAILTWKIDSAFFRQVIGVLVFAVQIPFLYWALFKNKIYKIK